MTKTAKFASRSAAELTLAAEGFQEIRECVWQKAGQMAFINLILGGRMPVISVTVQGA